MNKQTTNLIGPCKTIEEIEARTGYKFLDIFHVLAGAPADNDKMAENLSVAIGVSSSALKNPITRIRQRVLDIIAASSGVGKTRVWKALVGRPCLGRKSATAMGLATNTDPAVWIFGSDKGNPYVRIVQSQTASGQKEVARLKALAEAEANAVALADTMLAAGNE